MQPPGSEYLFITAPLGRLPAHAADKVVVERSGWHDLGRAMWSDGSRMLCQPGAGTDGIHHGEQPESTRARSRSRLVETSHGQLITSWPRTPQIGGICA